MAPLLPRRSENIEDGGSIATAFGTENTSFATGWRIRRPIAKSEENWSTGLPKCITSESSAGTVENQNRSDRTPGDETLLARFGKVSTDIRNWTLFDIENWTPGLCDVAPRLRRSGLCPVSAQEGRAPFDGLSEDTDIVHPPAGVIGRLCGISIAADEARERWPMLGVESRRRLVGLESREVEQVIAAHKASRSDAGSELTA